MLPLEDAIKEQFLSQFDTYAPGKKYEAEELLWGFFDSLYGLKLEENTQVALLRAKTGQEKLDADFYKRVKAKTEKDMEEEIVQDVETADLEQARKAMDFIVKEIQASKS